MQGPRRWSLALSKAGALAMWCVMASEPSLDQNFRSLSLSRLG